MRIVYFGSSNFSLPALKQCVSEPEFQVVGVITTPPQKQGRGLELTPTVVAQFCAENKIQCRDYNRLDDSALQETAALRPDIFVVASYGKMIPDSFLKLAKFRFNIHPSLLPKYRGASPLNGPILAGDNVTGLSIADVTRELDAGDIYFQEIISLNNSVDSEVLGNMLSEKSAAVISFLLKDALKNKLNPVKQDASKASYAGKLKKEDGRLTFSDSAEKWNRVARGLKPWPGAFTEIGKDRINIIQTNVVDSSSTGNPGQIVTIDQEQIIFQTGSGKIAWQKIKPAGKNEMTAADYARGRRWAAGITVL